MPGNAHLTPRSHTPPVVSGLPSAQLISCSHSSSSLCPRTNSMACAGTPYHGSVITGLIRTFSKQLSRDSQHPHMRGFLNSSLCGRGGGSIRSDRKT
eukprot:1157758-Pelagomonas_calceolata.AAC.6